MALSNRENFLRMFRGEPTDSVLWISDLTYWRDSQIMQGRLPAQYMGVDGFLKLHLDLGIMPYYIYAIDSESPKDTENEVSVHQIGGAGKPYNGVFGLKYEGVEISTEEHGDVIETRYKVGDRELVQKKKWLPCSFCYSFIEYPVKTIGDLKTLRAIVEKYHFYSTVNEYKYLAGKWGEYGVPIAPLPRSPMSALITDWMGLENFIFASFDYPDDIQKIIDCIDRANDPAFEIIIKSPAEVFHFCDNLSASNCASFFQKYADRYYKKRFSQLHRHGKKAAVHIDGTLRGILGQVAATGADAAEALTPKPVGDLEIDELRSESGDRGIILWGGFPGGLFTHQFSYKDIDQQVAAFLKSYITEGPFIAGSADQIPPDADLQYVKYISERLLN